MAIVTALADAQAANAALAEQGGCAGETAWRASS